MKTCDCEQISFLSDKIKQQEETIAQLMKTIAHTNEKVVYLLRNRVV